MTKHFVSDSCKGEKCGCGKNATHKLGEEIPSDEPCMSCGSAERFLMGSAYNLDSAVCTDSYHVLGVSRHNLTGYVCCACFTRVLGPATGCLLTDREKRALAQFRLIRDDDANVFMPPFELFCPACDGPLRLDGPNTLDTLMFVECLDCKACGQLPTIGPT